MKTLLRAATATAVLVACSDSGGAHEDGGSDGAMLDASDAPSSNDAKTSTDAGPSPVAVTLTRALLVVMDRAASRVGFAPHASCSAP